MGVAPRHDLCPEGHFLKKPFSAIFPEKIWPSLVPRQLSQPTKEKNNR